MEFFRFSRRTCKRQEKIDHLLLPEQSEKISTSKSATLSTTKQVRRDIDSLVLRANPSIGLVIDTLESIGSVEQETALGQEVHIAVDLTSSDVDGGLLLIVVVVVEHSDD